MTWDRVQDCLTTDVRWEMQWPANGRADKHDDPEPAIERTIGLACDQVCGSAEKAAITDARPNTVISLKNMG